MGRGKEWGARGGGVPSLRPYKVRGVKPPLHSGTETVVEEFAEADGEKEIAEDGVIKAGKEK